MKVAVVFAALLIVGSNAFLLDNVKDLLSTVGGHLDNLKEAGKNLLKGALAKGKEVLSGLVSKGAQLATTLAEKTGVLGAVVGKRMASSQGKDVTRDLSDMFNGLSKVKELFKKHGATLLKKFSDAMDRLKGIAMNVHKALTSGAATTGDVDKAVDAVVDDHTDAVNTIKRSLASRSVLSDLGDFFAPHLDTLKNAVSGVGNTLKGHATNLWNAVKDQVTALGGKLSGHVDKLKEHGKTLLDHGKNALDALKGAVGDVLSQTLSNVADPLKGAVQTASDAAGVVAGHVAGALSGAGSN